MKLKIGLPPTLAAALILALVVVACETADPPTADLDPDNQAVRQTPIPPEVRLSAREFARAQRLIEEDWEQFHTDFDQWRAGLSSCARSAAQDALRGFAGDLGEIAQRAHNLPRSAATRRLADRLIESAEKEEAGLRQLRDRWQPDATALFEAVDSARSEVLASQKSVADDLADLSESNGLTALDDAREFSAEFETVSQDWAALHDVYNSVRDDQDTLSSADSSTKLGEVIDDLKKVQAAIDNLTSSDTTKDMIADLKNAAEAEEAAFTQLKDTFDGGGASPEATPDATPEVTPEATLEATPDATPESTPESTPEASLSEDSQPSFTDTDGIVSDSDDVLKKVDDELQSIMNDSSSEKPGKIDAFRQQYDLLVRDWAAFHEEYNGWRRTEGNCSRVEVTNQLGDFALRFRDISKQVNGLPQASFLRPMGDSLLDAAQREEEALRNLRNTWRPFATDAYRALDQERNNSGRLRRRARVGVQELMQRFSISPGEL